MSQTAADIDQIRERQDARAIDSRFAIPEIEIDEYERFSDAQAEIAKAITKLRAGAQISYEEISGIVTEYHDELITALEFFIDSDGYAK